MAEERTPPGAEHDAAGGAPGALAVAGAGAPTVGALAAHVAGVLAAAGVADARREARDLVAALLDRPRFWPVAHAGEPAGAGLAERARAAARVRAAGAPFAYAAGRVSFRHLTLEVDERVLIPRQETEVLVDCVLEETRGAGGVAIDLGTGSGAIALSLALEGEFERVIATDVSAGALEVARANHARLAATLRAPVEFRRGSLFAPLAGVRARALVSNPPYISYDEAASLPPEVRDWEPPTALLSGAGGLAATAAIVRGAPAVLEAGGLLALEVDARRAALVAELVAADGRYRDVSVRLDLAGRERLVLARREGN